MELRDYQQRMIDDIRYSMRTGKRSICAVLGCGGGKSVIQGDISRQTTEKGNRVLFLVHRQELCGQITATFERCGVNFDLCDVMMVQTATRRLTKLPKPSLIITDECHHALSNSYTRIYDYFPDAVRLGFTATPCRMNEGGLGKVFDDLVIGPSTEWLIENHYLSSYEYFSVKLADALGVAVKRGDYDAVALAEIMEQTKIYGDTVENWKNIANGKQTIVYCASVKASKATAEEFRKAGISAAHIDGTTPKAERENLVEDFRQGRITVLSNVELFGEGFDVPDCEAVVLLRPTKSLTLFIQQSMRSMRYKDGKTALIIDHVGNVFLHGFPDDMREWTLAAKRKKTETKIKVKQCPDCYRVVPSNCKICPECGHDWTAEVENEERAERERKQAELTRLNKAEYMRTAPRDGWKKLKTWDDLVLWQREHGFKFQWCIHKAVELRIRMPSRYAYYAERILGI